MSRNTMRGVTRGFSTTSLTSYPRKALPKITPQPPTSAQLSAPPAPAPKFLKPIYRPAPAPHIRLSRPPAPQRHITDTDTALPLPTTFPAGEISGSYLIRPRIPGSKLDATENPYPYKYYEISLRRSLNGLPETTKEYARGLGLVKRHQVVWRKVGPRSAGQILRIRELVAVRLVNEIPEKLPLPTGYAKVGNVVANAV
ncbi:hypothetical protein SpCBS45565_g08228 [Spizellomyces sp. 'palustris']|nr:hypothetical protein SpCBS45565_g08228 [Spizellomyces sp. 'palustris']